MPRQQEQPQGPKEDRGKKQEALTHGELLAPVGPESLKETVALGDARILKSEYDVLAKILAQVDKTPEDLYIGEHGIRIGVRDNHVVQLYFNDIGLTSLPDTIGKLDKLEVLDVSGNQLTGLPEGMGELVKLRELDASGNQLTGLPKSILRLGKLRELDASRNQLTALPEGMGDLVNLEILDVSGNQLTGLPKSILRLGKLQMLDVSRNQLTALPENIWKKLTELKMFDSRGNPIN